MRARLVLFVGLWLAGWPAVGRAGDWPQFRGPGGSGVAEGARVPLEWGPDKNVLWKVKVPGVAWSSPIVWGDKVFVTTAVTENQRRPQGDGFGGGKPPAGKPPGGFGPGNPKPPEAVYRWEVCCLDRESGKILWKQLALESKPRIAIHPSNTYATETPATDGERVYASFGMHGLFCYDVSGKLLWKKDLGSYQTLLGWGTASSPVLDGDRLFVLCDNEERSFLVALDTKTGDELWRVRRTERTTWGTPYVWRNKLRTELVTLGPRVRSYDPATGKQLWELNIGFGQCASTPVGDAELLYVGAGGRGFGGFGGPGGRPAGGRESGRLYAVRAGAAGDVTPGDGESTSAGVAWSQPRAAPEMASPLLYRGHLYVLSRNGGIVACYNARTGQPVYRERLPGAGSFWASPWACDGKVFCLDDDGNTFILQAGPEFKLLGKNALKDMFWASPAVAGDTLLLRGVDYLYCIKP
jgi:outer membrane protein assembly factor BamB